jgi:hypothetical protein
VTLLLDAGADKNAKNLVRWPLLRGRYFFGFASTKVCTVVRFLFD